jgi:RNA polymerase sigma-70 factor (ECF subfamily)
MPSDPEFEDLVTRFYRPLYQFAFSLTRTEADAEDLTQQTFYTWAAKGSQLRDRTKVRTWLFSCLHNDFLNSRRRQSRFSHTELSQVEGQLAVTSSSRIHPLDAVQVLQALAEADEVFQAPVALFYLEDCSYKEIAEILNIPMGTVKSRLARGLMQLHRRLSDPPVPTPLQHPKELP